MNLNYDFETAIVELERVCDLLGMHLEFAEECPRGDYSAIYRSQRHRRGGKRVLQPNFSR